MIFFTNQLLIGTVSMKQAFQHRIPYNYNVVTGNYNPCFLRRIMYAVDALEVPNSLNF